MSEIQNLMEEISAVEASTNISSDQRFFDTLDLLNKYAETDDAATQYQISLYYAEFFLHDKSCLHIKRAIECDDICLPSYLLPLLSKSCLQLGYDYLFESLSEMVLADEEQVMYLAASRCLRDLYCANYAAAFNAASSILAMPNVPADARAVAHDVLLALFETTACLSPGFQTSLSFNGFKSFVASSLCDLHAEKNSPSFTLRSYLSPLSCLVGVKPCSSYIIDSWPPECLEIPEKSAKIKAFIHCHSEQGLRSFLSFFADVLDSEFEAYLTTTDPALSSELLEHFVDYCIVPNAGMRDYASKIIEYWHHAGRDELCLFTHCKESSTYWLYHANRQLFEPHSIDFVRVLNGLQSDCGADQLGVLLPSPPPHVPAKVFANQVSISAYFDFVGHKLDPRLLRANRYLVFPVGNSFYASRQCLDSLRSWLLSCQSELIEPLPKDGTPLHAAERLLPFSAELVGKQTACTEFFRA